MKFSAIFTAAMATFAVAAPAATTTETRDIELPAEVQLEARNIDISGLNGLRGFRQDNLNYLLRLNQLDLNILNQLGQVNNLNLGAFQHLFNVQVFDVQALLQLQQLNFLVGLHAQGLFNGVNLANLNFKSLNFGLIQGVQGINLGQFIGQDVIGQVGQIAKRPTNLVIS